MRQYDICRNGNAASRKLVPFVVILQADLLSDFQTVIVAPLMAETLSTKINKLNPTVKVDGKTYRVSIAELAGVLRKQLGEVVANVEEQHLEFVAAIDLVFTGI
jgi:toxin CcdB